ncbi:MAG: PKD domain-containing protein [Pseudotabrizicola sp.]|uniref:PKD domain-containing protein n=1 Tax=Pseudotabrizicola sp. TaxID=2939647 RepID=UPI00271724FF|nr:PKD domain-containing protein [Pseudotabrizicola sp.]MDO9640870.1 PKD domain-containing protein [Pseudotabrizicola sp.]
MSKTITVSTHAELISALGMATGGETILLNPGNYGDLSLVDKPKFDLDFTAPVTIAAADPANPPVVTGLKVHGATDLHFENILFDYTYQDGQPNWYKPFTVSGSESISFTDCTFDGDVARGLTAADNGYPTGFGLNVTGTTGITVDNCEIHGFFRGLLVSNSDDVAITDNDIHSIRMDGMNFAAVQGVLIEGNHIHDFLRSMDSDDHADMIQFWTSGTTRPSTDIVIRDNILDIGNGHYTQSILMRNELVDRGLAGEEMFYRNVTIEGNIIVNGHLHGITVGETAGLTITNNTVLHDDGANPDGPDSSVEIPRISVAVTSTNVTITHNATSAISGHNGQSDWTVGMNAFVQDQNPNAPGWYGDVFIASTLTSPEGAKAIKAHPDGILAHLNAGAASTMPSSDSSGLDAAFHSSSDITGGKTVTFDASHSTGPQPEGTKYVWDFGDGTKATGATVTHTYTDGGKYDARLTVILPDGTYDTAMARVVVNDTELVSLTGKGTFVASVAGTDTVLTTIATPDAGGGIQLGGPGVSASVARTYLTPVFGSDDVTISLRLDADAAGATGEVVRLHNSFIVSVNAKGEVAVRAWSSAGEAVTLTSTGIRVNDGSSYDIDIRLEEGRLSLWVDDKMVQDTAFNGTFADVGNHNLTFGNPWNSGFFNGDVTEFTIAVNDGPTLFDPPGEPEKDAAVPPVPVPLPPPPPPLLHLSDNGTLVVTQDGARDAIQITGPLDPEGGIQLGGPGISASVARSHLAPILGSDDVTISLRLDADAAGTTGEVLRLTGSFIVSVDYKGEIVFRAWSSEGEAVKLTSTGIRVNDGSSYDIDIRLEEGRMSLWVDGKMVQDTAFNGTFADVGRHDLTFGNPWHSSFFNGDVTEFAIAVNDGPTLFDPFSAHAMDMAAPLM